MIITPTLQKKEYLIRGYPSNLRRKGKCCLPTRPTSRQRQPSSLLNQTKAAAVNQCRTYKTYKCSYEYERKKEYSYGDLDAEAALETQGGCGVAPRVCTRETARLAV